MKKRLPRVKTLTGLRNRCTRHDPQDPNACWTWNGATRGKGYPAVWMIDPSTGKEMVVSGARAVAILKGKEIPRPGKSWTTCGNKLCCNPKHEMTGTYAEWGAWKRENDAWPRTARMLAAAKARGQRLSKINLEIARQMRASPLPPLREAERWSRELGTSISHDVVIDVRAGRRWPEPNPFAGLLG